MAIELIVVRDNAARRVASVRAPAPVTVSVQAEPTPRTLVVRDMNANAAIAVKTAAARQIVMAGQRGASGVLPEATLITQVAAGEALGGHRAVYQQGDEVLYAQQSDLSTAEAVVGVTLGAAGMGDTARVQRFGVIDEPTWAWAPGAVFLGANGTLTQTAPETGVLLQLGVALSATQLDVRIGTPIEII